ALETYSLLYDIKQKKPALDLREGEFYNGIPDISIKVAKKFKDGVTLKDVTIYDHRGRNGNKQVTKADSGKMCTIFNEQYLKLELFRGYNYDEGSGQDLSGRYTNEETFSKTKFDKTEIVFDLSSFGLQRTEKKWFASNRIMRNMAELEIDMDSMTREIMTQKQLVYNLQKSLFFFNYKKDSIPMSPDLSAFVRQKDSLALVRQRDTTKKAEGVPLKRFDAAPPSAGGNAFVQNTVKQPVNIRPKEVKFSDSIFKKEPTSAETNFALGKVRMVKSQLQNSNAQIDNYRSEYRVFEIQWHKIMANSIACIAMFLIGAPLGAIIKKGGLGVPVIASIFFFIVFYVLSLMGEKWARAETLPMIVGMWMPCAILFTIGLVFLRQARADARLFDADFYSVVFDRIKKRLPTFLQVKSEPA
ncbi:MAG TPA: LptF/LptG family permease, partial [Cyclobacteriaceae bacterium]|nr:LptF/LptG family permease [Cyclobacteriaceae bacterium]